MLAGRYRYYYQYQWEISYSLTDAESGGVSMTSYTAPNAVDKNTGIQIALATTLPGDETEFAVAIPAILYGDTFTTGAFQTSATGTLTINDLEIYIEPVPFNPLGGWRVEWSSIVLELDGSTVHTIPGNSITCPYFAPAGLPLFGVPPRLTGSGGIGTIPVAGSILTCTSESETVEDAACEFTGGWRVKMTSTSDWLSAPMSVYFPATTPSVSCPCDLDLPDWPAYSVTNTWNARGTAGAKLTDVCELYAEDEQCNPCGTYKVMQPTIRDVYKGTRTYETWASTFMLLPNVPKDVKRWKSANYRQMVLRYGFPAATAQSIAICGPWSVDPGTTISNTVVEEVYPSTSALLANVGNAAHAIEDVMAYDSFAPAGIGRSIGRSIAYNGVTTQFGMCGLIEEPSGLPDCTLPAVSTCYAEEVKVFPLDVEDSIDQPDMIGYYDHADAECRLVNTWFSPHASYFVWFPPNTTDSDGDGVPDEQGQWQVNSDDIDAFYWFCIRQQWLSQSALPDAEKTRTRNNLPMDPLDASDLALWLGGVGGFPCNFWGQHNFMVDDWTPPASLAMDATSEDLITATNCTVTLDGSGITVTPDPGETSFWFDIALASFATYPYYYPQIAKLIELGWTITGATVTVSLISHTGTSKQLATTPGSYAFPLGTDGKYAFSYAQDYGHGYLTDTGEDVTLSGISADITTSVETTHAFQMLGGREAAKLRFAFTIP